MKGLKKEKQKQNKTKYFSPGNVKEAVEILAEIGEEVEVLAGGTDLLVRYYERLYDIDYLLDLRLLEGLEGIKLYDDRIEIGARATHSQLEKSEYINKYFPIIGQAAANVGSPQIRNRGTIGGNIVNASPAGDLLPGMLAYEAKFKLVSAKEEIIVSAEDFFVEPGKTILKPNQLLTKVILPKPEENTYSSWIKIGMRKTVAITTISLALVLKLKRDNNTIKELRTCLGSVAPTPLLIRELNREIKGEKIDQLDFNRLGELVADIISPIDDVRATKEYRKEVARNIMIESLEKVAKLR
ncbi:xanthine dehydrogenase family protein subunit M [Natroniella acetigena]|uniref:FAD binding domain-containing protein n=1 Tax=Natroniella acetigena TaxID=52004 RepID=UPI00200B203E|nr:xanthine dehydrogenase family protein subunit M [Natroniella acetigena]MCK8827295.1 xanthine dehydrogenase family protein subunit M [Natroniella acetigena]